MAELIGYLASALVVVSLLMTSVVRLRVLNLIGAATFVVYAALISSVPVGITNAVIVVINMVFLLRAALNTEAYSIARLQPDDEMTTVFLESQAEDISRAFPGFAYDGDPSDLVFLIMRDLAPAALFIARPEGDTARVLLDYAVPRFRDLGPGRHLFEEGRDVLRTAGITRLTTQTEIAVHRSYLQRIGFVEEPDGTWVMDLG